MGFEPTREILPLQLECNAFVVLFEMTENHSATHAVSAGFSPILHI